MAEDGDVKRILVLDRDRSTCQALGRAIAEAEDFRVVGMTASVEEARKKVATDGIDFVVASSHLPTSEVLEAARWLKEGDLEHHPHLLVTGLPDDEATILNYLEKGASGFTLGEFSIEGLRLAMRLIARGEALVSMRLTYLLIARVAELAEVARDRGLDPANLKELTPRESDVLELLNEELTNKEIAKRLYVSEGTVKSHVHQILRKLKVRGREEAVRVYRIHRAGQED